MDCRERRISCQTRNWLTLLLGVVVVVAILLVSGLSGVELQPGQGFAVNGPGTEAGTPVSVLGINSDLLRTIFHVIGITLLVLLVPSIIYAIITPDVLKRAIARAIYLAATMYALYLFFTRGGISKQIAEALAGPSAGAPLGASTIPSGMVLDPPAWLTLVITVTILALAFNVAAVLWQRARLARRSSPLEMLAIEAQEAIQELRAGADLKDVVLRCYHEMSRVLNEERGLRRQEAMTPREFETILKEVGLPAPPVERLTQLFESVRYGANVPGEQEEKDALACLEAIVEACGSPA
jgi:hypothetical protein